MAGERVGVLLAAGGAGWEVEALRLLATDHSRVALVKRCVDLHDLLATASTGQARVAVVSADLPGLDADSMGHLARAGVAVLGVSADGGGGRGRLPGLGETVAAEDVDTILDLVAAAAVAAPCVDVPELPPELPAGPGGAHRGPWVEDHAAPATGRLVAVWGPAGAPGRTTVAVALAAASAARGQDTMLVDADSYGGAAAQHLGVLDEVSGLLSAVRLANAGRLDVDGLAAVARQVAPGLRLVTGLPRADRWVEVRDDAYETLLDVAATLCARTVLDLGFCLEQDGASYGGIAPQRNQMTVSALDRADEIVVVGSADPVGLARLARGLVELLDLLPAATVRVVVNKVRPSLGWRERDVRTMVEGFVSPASIHFLPHDLDAVDRALLSGCALVDMGDSALGRALLELAAAVGGMPLSRERRLPRLRRRRAGRAR